MKKVYGSYASASQARRAVDELLGQGYTNDEIKVISNEGIGGDLEYMHDEERYDDRSLWEKIKDAFTFDEYDEDYWDRDLDNEERTVLKEYKTNLQAGETIVLVEDKAGMNREGYTGEYDSTGAYDRSTDYDRDLGDEERTIDLKKEKLRVDKEEVEAGEVGVRKVVREETQTIEVPVEKEEIVIERRPAGDKKVRDGETIDSDSFEEGEEIHIPIKEERVHVSKETVVDDEVVIRKDKHTEDQTVSEKVRHEDIEVEGDARVEDETLDRDMDLDRKKRNKDFDVDDIDIDDKTPLI